jgi:GNAT superfamily N-acetyltransferase
MRFDLHEATVSDVAALAALHVETFRETHGGGPIALVRAAQWQRILSANDATDFTFVVDAAHQLVGFARGVRHDGGVPGYQGELNKIYVLRRFHGQGIGRLLVCRVAEQFLKQHIHSMLLFGDARSPSNGFYEHLGAVKLLSAEGEFHGGYAWRDLGALAARCRTTIIQ